MNRPEGRPNPRWLAIALLLTVTMLAVALIWRGGSSVTPDDGAAPGGQAPVPATEPAEAGDAPAIEGDDSPACDPGSLPAQAWDTAEDIESGGPYAYERDGVVFENREGLLPPAPYGFYHEYTVDTPGSPDRGARRIVTADEDPAAADDVLAWWYTEDHYASFCRITEVP